MTVSDETLAQAAANGDKEAFASLLSRHYDRIFRLCFRLTVAQSDAEDLCQDICMALPRKMQGYASDAKFTTWLYRVVVNASNDRWRRQATYAKATEGWGEVERARRAEAVEAEEALDWLNASMRTLPSELRETLALVLDDVTHKEAGQILGVCEGTISWRISEAKKRLKQLKDKSA